MASAAKQMLQARLDIYLDKQRFSLIPVTTTIAPCRQLYTIYDLSTLADMVSTVENLLLDFGPMTDGAIDATEVAHLLVGRLPSNANTKYMHLEHYKVGVGNTSPFKGFLTGYCSISADNYVHFTPIEVAFLFYFC
ncbi:hypothetical protein EG329_008209 [Mollisiaceae sp. DMI_Dod_QoI]|nr:hypothetical protein EG329_008209 [Helotiales sp. DMI_Dod_QoI]